MWVILKAISLNYNLLQKYQYYSHMLSAFQICFPLLLLDLIPKLVALVYLKLFLNQTTTLAQCVQQQLFKFLQLSYNTMHSTIQTSKQFNLTMRYLLIVILVSVSFADLGIDLQSSTSQASLECLLKERYNFVNIRAYRSFGGVDPNAPQTIANARKAGYTIQNIGVYMFPCSNNPQKSALTQMAQMMQLLKGSEYSSIWIRVETNTSPKCEWSTTNFTQNCNFMTDLMNAVTSLSAGKKVAIYASRYMWAKIFGSVDNCAKFNTYYPLWYPHYDSRQAFTDFITFAGWKFPQVKQYKGTTEMCSASVYLNYKE